MAALGGSASAKLDAIERELAEFATMLGIDFVPRLTPHGPAARIARPLYAYEKAADLARLIWSTLATRMAVRIAREIRMNAMPAESGPNTGALPPQLSGARDETLRLIEGLFDLTRDIQSVKGLLRESEPSKARLLDTASAARQGKILRNEKGKVERLEAVLSVIGTVKAGKSTVINAIVGMELLPNRKLPMTTYPTFIRHDEDRREPLLRVPMAGEFTDLVERLKPLIAARAQGADPGDPIIADETVDRLARAILASEVRGLQSEYSGREQVVAALEIINDLTRLAAEFGLDAPTPANAARDALPSISVRFSHMRDLALSEGGQIALLDTPGPNETGIGDGLRRIVRQAIEETSATILVADFTQLRVEATDEIQDVLREGLFDVLDRVYVFVNKYDQASTRDWSVAETRENVSKLLLHGKIPAARIFPVSGLGGFLANAAHRALETDNQLPQTWWALDFARRFGGVGQLGERLLNDPQSALIAAREGWSESGLDEPLTHVISHAAQHAALICLNAALEKVVNHGNTTSSFLGVREAASTISAEALRSEIAELGREIAQVEAARGGVLERVDRSFEAAKGDLAASAKDVEEELEAVLDAFFQSGRIKVTREVLEQAAQEVRKRRPQRDIRIDRRIENAEDVVELDPARASAGLILALMQLAEESPTNILLQNQYSSRAEAQAQFERVRGQVNAIVTRAEDELARRISGRVDALAEEIDAAVHNDLRPVLGAAEARLRNRFDVVVSFPPLAIAGKDLESNGLNAEAVLKTKQKSDYNLKQRDSVGGKVKRGFGSLIEKVGLGGVFSDAGKWGYDKEYFTVNLHVVDIDAIRKRVWEMFGGFRNRLEARLDEYVRQPVRQAVDLYFRRLGEYLDGFRNDLGDALRDKSLEEAELKALCEQIVRLKAMSKDVLEDALAAGDGIEAWARERV